MRRLALTAFTLLSLAVPAGVAAAPGVASASASAAASVRASIDECGVVTSRRLTGVSFSAEMGYMAGAQSMWMRFELLSRQPGESAFGRVPNTGEGWYRERAVRTFRYDDKIFAVPRLGTTAEYRARVVFRWNDADGHALAVVRRLTPVCTLSPQPNLSLGAMTTQPAATSAQVRYSVSVLNTGPADAGAFDVGLRVAGQDRPTVSLPALTAGGSQQVTFTAPRCASGETLRFEVDPGALVAESDETDNVLSVACPTST
jgi:CARDB